MRVTTQMLNESARKAGLPIHDKSLLNYINQGNKGNDLLNALSSKGNGKQNAVSNRLQKSNFEKTEKQAEGLEEKAAVFLDKENNIFDKAKESGDNKELLKSVKDMVSAYNDMVQTLSKETGAMSRLYLETLKGAAKENTEAFKKIGINISKDGKLEIDDEKLAAAGIDDLETVFGSGGKFTPRVSFVAGRAADNAAANLESISNQYTSDGNAYTAALLNRFDSKG